jgi:hypothetical protein
MQRIPVREGIPLEVDANTAQAIRRRLVALQRELQPRIGFLTGTDVLPVVQNLVGSVQVSSDLILDIEPKTSPDQNWAAALIDLLVEERVEFGSETYEAEMLPRLVLVDAFARLYAEQLDRAVRREGPLAVMMQRYTARQRLVGRLDVTRWVTQRITKPATFPQQETVLTVDNQYTVAMAWVAEALAVRCVDSRLSSRLRAAASRVRPGLPEHSHVDPGVALRDIPPQWSAYGPAWATTRAVLRRISPLHRSGTLEGFGLAVEPWPLLERLLHRGLHAAARQAQAEGVPLSAKGHSKHKLLTPEPSTETPSLWRLSRARAVEPDGSLWLGDQIVANFETKYSRAESDSTFRGHVFQVMTTAAALDSPLAVLVYPEPSDPVSWSVHGFNGKPLRLVAVGLNMFGYRRRDGDNERGALLLTIVRGQLPVATRA